MPDAANVVDDEKLLEQVSAALLTALAAKDIVLRRHSERIAEFLQELGTSLGLSAEELRQLHYGALLHDVGNIGMADTILLKPGGLTPQEFEEMKLHPIIGEQICRPLECLQWVRPMVRSHHEKLDGSGYPDGHGADELPRLVTVLTVVDIYDSLRCQRTYRQAFGHQQALEILREEVGRGWWNRDAVECLAELDIPESEYDVV